MSIDLMFEADPRFSEREFEQILTNLGVNVERDEEGNVCGNFPVSHMYVVGDYQVRRDEVIAEGVPYPMFWKVGMRAVFNYSIPNYDLCDADVHQFLIEVVKATDANFVLSFQFETVYAVHDSHGFRLMSHFGGVAT